MDFSGNDNLFGTHPMDGFVVINLLEISGVQIQEGEEIVTGQTGGCAKKLLL